jgi:hypothetical protein
MENTENTDAKTGMDSSNIPSEMLSSPDMVITPAEGKANADDKGGDDDKSKAADDKVAADASSNTGDGKDESQRLDRDGRFKQLEDKLAKESEARKAAETRLDAILKPPADVDPKDLPFKLLDDMTDAEIREWQEDDPKGFAKNQQDMATYYAAKAFKDNTVKEFTQAAVAQTFEEYGKENPDFNEKWENGEIETYMKAHPGHNAISAHMKMTEEVRINAAVAKAVKETEAKVAANFAAKRGATIIQHGGGARKDVSIADPALKDTKQFGGDTAVLARRLEEMRRSGA